MTALEAALPVGAASTGSASSGSAHAAASAELRDDFTRRLVSVAFLVRLLALVCGTAALVGSKLTLGVMVVLLTLGATSYLGMSRESRMIDLAVRHPIYVMVDVLLVVVATYVVGADSPLVLATLSTALVVGLLLPTRAAVVIGVALVGGYTGVWGAGDTDPHDVGFFVMFGIPLLYVSLIGIGHAVRVVHREQVDVLAALATSRAATASADERARLAREMHDSLAKTLHGVAMGAAALPHWVGTDPVRAVEQAQLLADGAERAAEEARTLLKRMRADQPDRPLAEILGGLCRDWAQLQAVHCEFTASAVVDVSSEVRYELVSIAGECLENVARHAGASHVTMSLRRNGDVLELDVTDDGRGMDVDIGELGRSGHYGVQGMDERARSVGGALHLLTPPGGGTTVRVTMPYAEAVAS